MTEMKEATIFDPNAHIEAIAIRFDTGSETWELQSIGTVEECRASCDRARNKGCEHEMRLYRVGRVPDRSHHGTIELGPTFNRALTPDEVKELADTPPDFVQEDGLAIYTRP